MQNLYLVWILGHTDIMGNELADKAAKIGCSQDQTAPDSVEIISKQVLFGWIKDQVFKRWGQMWRISAVFFLYELFFLE